MTVAHGSIEYWAQTRPNDIALIDGERSTSYAEWNVAADCIAHGLNAHGLNAGDIVVVRTQIRTEWALIASALAKLQCSLLALNWRLTSSEVRHVLANSGARALICDDPSPAMLAPATKGLPIGLMVSIDTPAPGFVAYSELLKKGTSLRFSAKDPPLIIYTSGTTGVPKGVTTGRRSPFFSDEQVMEYQKDVRNSRRSDAPNPAVLITMPLHHGAGPAQLWSAMRTGRKAILMRRFDPEGALQLIQRHRVTDWNSVPTMLKRIAAMPKATLESYDVSSLRHLSVGAAPIAYSLKEWALDFFGEHCLSEGYGSTETGMVTRLAPEMQRKKPGSSGRPYRHVSIEVRDNEGKVLPAGQVGELWIRTPTTVTGYLNASPLTSDSLDAQGFFRVGDIGYLDDDGYLYITDRAKDLIIAGGVNIYPAEIEAAILKHPAVLDAAVIGIPDDEFGEQVKAFCELKPGRHATGEMLSSFLSDHLASYKRPKSFEFLAELPRNTMGKLVKRELRDPYWQNRERKV